jgi:subtilisin family serine protease
VSRLKLRFLIVVGTLCSMPALAQEPLDAFVANRVLVRFAPGTAANERAIVRQALEARATRSLSLVPGLEVMQTALDVPQALALLASNPNVLYAEPDYIVQPISLPPPVIANDEHFPLQWGLHNTGQDIRGVIGNADADIDMAEAWNMTTGDGTTIVAVIDTGTQYDHPDLDANIWENTSESLNGLDDDLNGYVDDIRGWDFFSDDNNPDDSDGHGTHTAGTICAEGDNSIGVAGVLWACKIMPLRFLGPMGGSNAGAIEALGYAVANGAFVSNNSWGGGPYSQALYDAIAAAGAEGHVFVAAAGNSARNNDTYLDYPSSYDLPNIISVAASDNTDLLASFSNYGVTTVDVAAPGWNIASTFAGSAYYWASGTSMATPHVTGVVALVQELNPGMPMADVIDRVLSTARPVQALTGLMATGGVVNAYNALYNVVPPAPPPPPPVPTVPSEFSGTNNGDGSALVTWMGDELADYYILERDEYRTNGRFLGRSSFEITDTAPGESEAYQYLDVTGKRNNRYRVVAINENGSSPWTNWIWVHVTTDGDGTESGGGGSGRCHPKKGC